MRIMTATEVARGFSHIFDEVEHGETIIVTRGGERILRMVPEPRANGAALLTLLDDWDPVDDPEFEANVTAIREESRNFNLDSDPWAD
ncbi:MAG TPA: type II toxin-antitoxin system Phd/YefM family antitoxin [Pseudonocardiaceae bacterium]|jgi:antitoxin (DNA-binding transcriptional repressor) of toxin-antitoxin stability system|nr:type II toxin-antitoxin system Phd/YefM family antitoxin [Pseudonocardiaceae bacterium]